VHAQLQADFVGQRSNWPNSFLTARWSASNRAMASGPRSAVDLAAPLRAAADFLGADFLPAVWAAVGMVGLRD